MPNKILDLTDLYLDEYATTSRVDLKGFFRFNTNLPSCYFPSGAVYMTLTKEDGTIISGPTDLASYLGASSDPKATCVPPDNPVGIQFTNSYNLTPGKYVWKLSFYSSTIQIQDVTLKINYNASKGNRNITNSGDVLENADFAGGLRIKRIIDYDNITATPKIKRYYYHTTRSNGKKYSYGRRMAKPIYTYYDDSYTLTSCPVINEAETVRSQHLIRESDSNIPLNGSASGSVVGYDTVVVFYGENGEYGKSEYRFENQPDYVWNYSEADQMDGNQTIVPRKPPILASYSNAGNGNVNSEIDYKNQNGTFIKVKEAVNTYTEQLGANNVLWYGIEKRKYNNAPYQILYPFRAYVYPTVVEGRNLLTSSVVTTYDAFNTNLSLTQTTNYNYNNNTHLQLVSMSQSTSKGFDFITNYTYPLDYADADCDAAILEMKGSRFNHSAVITKKTNVSSEINKFQIKNGLVVLAEIAVLENTTALTSPQPPYQPSSGTYPPGFKPRIKFDDYDASGNILQMKKSDDVTTSYIYGYNNTYPIAEVTNAPVTGVAYTSFEPNTQGNWNFSGSITNLPGAPTGKGTYNLTQANGNIISRVSTLNGQFIVSFWLKNASGNVTVNGSTGSAIINRNGWSLYTVPVTVASAAITVSGTGTIDELRLYPRDAVMSTYTYDPLIGMTSQCDINNRITYYIYDTFGRLKLVRDQDNKILKTFDYKYQQNP